MSLDESAQITLDELYNNLNLIEKKIIEEGMPSEFQSSYILDSIKNSKTYIPPGQDASSLFSDKDHWGNALNYSIEGQSLVISSNGQDGKSGTEDDISLSLSVTDDKADYSETIDKNLYEASAGVSWLFIFTLTIALIAVGWVVILKRSS